MEDQAHDEDQDIKEEKKEEKKEDVCFLPRLQGGFDAGLQFSRTKKPCGCLCTSEDKKIRQQDETKVLGINGLRGEISSLFHGSKTSIFQKCPHLSLFGERVSSRA